MFRKKAKTAAEQQGTDRRQSNRGGIPNPAFSYYTSRTPEVTRDRQAGRQEQPETGKSGRLPRSFSQVSFWLLVAIVLVCLGKVLWLSTSPKVEVVGKSPVSANYIQSNDIYAAAAGKLLRSSITSHTKLTVNLDGTAAALQRQFPELQSVSLAVPLIGNRPIVYVQLASPSAVVQTVHGNYALNASGVVLAKLQSVPADIPLVVDQSGTTPAPGKQFLPGSTVSFLQTVAYQFQAAKLSISTFVLPSGSPYELDVRLSGQPYVIRCNLEADALTQSGAAIAVVQQLGGTTPAAYIDVRVPNRAYYK